MDATSVSRSGMTRQQVLKGALAGGAVLGLAACGSGSKTTSGASQTRLKRWKSADIDWQQFKGTTLVFQVESHPWVSALKPYLPDFTELTGIKVNVLNSGEQDMISKLAVQLKSGSATPDLMLVPAYPQYVANKWLAPLGNYLHDKKLTDPKFYDEADIFPVAKKFVGWGSANLCGLPITSEVETIFYRKDLVDGPLKTYDQLMAAATAAKKGSRAGIALRGQAQWTMGWTCQGFVFGNGGYILDDSGKPTLDSPNTVEAVDYYARLLQKAGPVGAASWDWQQVNQAFESDKAAIVIDSSVFAGEYYDPKKNPNADQVAAAPFPQNGKGLKPAFWHWVVGANAKSKNLKAAWLFLMWATSPATSELLGKSAVVVPRKSVWKSKSFLSAYNEQAANVVLKMNEEASAKPYLDLYTNKALPKVGTDFAIAMSSAIAGEKKAAVALRQAQRKATSG